MMTPVEERKDDEIRAGMVLVSDGKCQPRPARLVLTMEAITVQQEVVVPVPKRDKNVPHIRERMVSITRQKVGGLGLSIKGGAEHKLPILISKIYKNQAADQTGQLFVGDAVIKVNGEYITACKHDDAVSILRDAGDIVVLTVKHYRAALPFLQKQDGASCSDTDSSGCEEGSSEHNTLDDNCNSTHLNGVEQIGSRLSICDSESSISRPGSAAADPIQKQWKDIVSVPLMMAYVTRYIFGTDKLRPNAFEVRGARPNQTTGVIHLEDPAVLSMWLKNISDNITGLTNLQMKLLNRQLSAGQGQGHIEYMCWVFEGEWLGRTHRYRPRFLQLTPPDALIYDYPPMNVSEVSRSVERLKIYETLFRVVRESETIDWRQHCFIIQGSTGAKYCSCERARDLERLSAHWAASLTRAVRDVQKKSFSVVHTEKPATLTLDWNNGFSLSEGTPGSTPVWAYRFSQLRGSSDDGKSKLKLHFQDVETKVIETKELECQILQNLLFCMHSFLTAKVASVDPAFLDSVHPAN